MLLAIIKVLLKIIKKIINELIKSTKSDVIITTGGVSVGDRDLIRSSLDEIGFDESSGE